MKIEYVDPPVENDELSVWRNYRQIKCCVKDGNDNTLIIAWKREDGKHIVVWRLDYSHSERCLYVKCRSRNPNTEKCLSKKGKHAISRSGSCWESFDSIEAIIALVDSWKSDTDLHNRMKKWYGSNTQYMPVFDNEYIIEGLKK